jgi:hypothetical protein
MIDRHQLACHESSKIKSPCHIPTFASQLTEEYNVSARSAIHRLALSTRPNSLDYGLQVHLQTHFITASKCISNPARLDPPSTQNLGLPVHLHSISIAISECISQFTQSRPPSVCSNTVNYRLQLHLQTHSITASECISAFIQLSFSCAPRIALKHHLQPVQIHRG